MMSRMRRVSVGLCVAFAAIGVGVRPAASQVDEPVDPRPGIIARPSTAHGDERGAEVLLDGLIVMRIHHPDRLSPLRRAELVAERLEFLRERDLLKPGNLRVVTQGKSAVLMAGPHMVITATPHLAKQYGVHPADLAKGWKSALLMALGG